MGVMKIKQLGEEGELNALRKQEFLQNLEDRNLLRDYIATTDMSTPEGRAGTMRYGKTGLEYNKALNENQTSALTQKKTGFDILKLQKDFIAQAQRDTALNPSDENIKAYVQDLNLSELFTAAQKVQMKAGADRILAMPISERQAFMASQGATSRDLKETTMSQTTGATNQVLRVPAFSGTATVVPGSVANVTPTQNQIEANQLARDRLNQTERHFNAGGYTYDLDRGIRIDRNGVATKLMQQGTPDVSAAGLPVGTPNAPVTGGIPAGRATLQSGSSPQSNLVPLGPRPVRVAPNELRDEVNTLTKDFRVVQDAHTQIKSVANTGAGDMSLLYSFVKLLDPGSVVRESEFAAAAQSGSYGERVQGAVNRAMTGQRLPDSLRKDFIREADNLYQSQKSGNDRVIKHYTEVATRAGIDPRDVILPYAAPEFVIPDEPPANAVRERKK
jgi:hypothetical protein